MDPRDTTIGIRALVPGSQRVVGSSEMEGDPATLGDNGMERRPETQVNSIPSNFPLPKLELQVFDETKPRWWLCWCEKLFGIHQMAKD